MSLVGVSPHAVIALDRDSNVRIWNSLAERIFGWAAAEVMDRPAPAFIPRSAHEASDSAFQLELQGELSFREAQAHRKDGSPITIRIVVGVTKDRNGTAIGTVALIEDLTATNKIEEEHAAAAHRLERLNRSRTELLRRLITVQEDERRRIAQEIHDHSGQALVVLAKGLETVVGSAKNQALIEIARRQLSPREKNRYFAWWHWDIQIRRSDRNSELASRPSILIEPA